MKVFYRSYPGLSSTPNPLGRDKNQIIKRCLDSFIKAGGGDITFLVDRSTEEQIGWFKKYGKVVHTGEGLMVNRNKAFEMAFELSNEEKVLFLEDDYLWLPDTMPKLEKALDTLRLMSPYDHPGHYLEERFKHQPKKMAMIENQTYRQAPSNTHTFACFASTIKQNRELFIETWGDHETFTELGIDMYVPVPSFATHLVTGLLAPNISWNIENP